MVKVAGVSSGGNRPLAFFGLGEFSQQSSSFGEHEGIGAARLLPCFNLPGMKRQVRSPWFLRQCVCIVPRSGSFWKT